MFATYGAGFAPLSRSPKRKKERRQDAAIELGVTPGHEPEPGLDLGDLGAAYGDKVRRRAVELDDCTIPFLADAGHMGDPDDMAAVHAQEKRRIELGFGFRDRPGAHPLAD